MRVCLLLSQLLLISRAFDMASVTFVNKPQFSCDSPLSISNLNAESFQKYRKEINSVIKIVCNDNEEEFRGDFFEGKGYSCQRFPEEWSAKNYNELLDPNLDVEKTIATIGNLLNADPRFRSVKELSECSMRRLKDVDEERCIEERAWTTVRQKYAYMF